jgi:DNA mismatch repair protein MutS
MKIDRQTLRDLEVFEAPPGGRSVFELLDRTRTAGGRRRLRQRLAEPPAALADVLRAQEAVRFLAAHPGIAEVEADDALLKEVEGYLDSNYAPAGHGGAVASAAAAWYRLRWGDNFAALARGVRVTLHFLRALRTVARDLEDMNAPALLAEQAARIRAATEGSRAEPLRLDDADEPLPARRVLAVDRLLRERMRAEVAGLRESLYELDALASMAEATTALGMRFPKLIDADRPVVRIRGLRHPLLERAVPNDFALEPGRTLIFLTGPNMAGKTTYMKAAALCVLLAHAGAGVPADEMELSAFDRLFGSINTTDNVRLGYSYFFSEVRRVKEAAQVLARGERTFFVFDEIFKGTNVRDALDASRMVISGLAASAGSVFIVSSHLAELAPELEALGTVQLRYFDARIEGGEPRYDYRLKPGSSPQRLGLLLLEREGVPALFAKLRGG